MKQVQLDIFEVNMVNNGVIIEDEFFMVLFCRHAGKSSTSKAHTAVECCAAHKYRGCSDHSICCAAGGECATSLEGGNQVTAAGSLGALMEKMRIQVELGTAAVDKIFHTSAGYDLTEDQQKALKKFTEAKEKEDKERAQKQEQFAAKQAEE
jgi:hypothetical protein